MKHISKSLLIMLVGALLPVTAIAKNPNVLDISQSITDNAIIYPETFEMNTQKLLESWYMKNYTSTDDRYRTMPDVKVTDDVIIKRLQALPTIIPMPFNQIVRAYIDRYTQKSRPQVAALLGLSNYYMPIFEQALEQEGLPLELKYLPVIESGLDPNAVSKHGATGLWQFMLAAARGLGMEVNSLVDERRDPYIASEKAAAFLKDLYGTYGDWSLAIAAYNCGPRNVNKAIRRAGGDPKQHNFWTIYKYLPSETRGYVPMFIAANYVMNYYQDHNISPVLATKPLVTDTIGITTRVHFDQISKVLNIPVQELRLLNPQFRADIIPGSPESPYYLILPSQQIHAYIMSEEDILNYNAAQYAQTPVIEPGGEVPRADQGQQIQPATPELAEQQLQQEEEVAQVRQQARPAPAGSKLVTHKVKPAESLASIAQQYGVTPEQIKEWNSLRRNTLRTGQQLRIQVADASQPARQTQPAQPVAAQPAKPATSPKKPKKNTEQAGTTSPKPKKEAKPKKQKPKKEVKPKKSRKPKVTTHTVASGESVERVARRYGVSVNDVKKANGLKGNNPVLQPGQKLKIPGKAKAKKPNKKKKRR